jgi:hypothetical protein
MKKVIALLLGFIVLNSCKNDVLSMYNVADNSENVPLEIKTYIEGCINCGCHWRFEGEEKYEKIIRYSKLYFSPDSTKFFVIVTTQVDGKQNYANSDVLFEVNGDAFIGYKENDTWQIYYYEEMMPTGFTSYKVLEEGMIDYFEGENYKSKAWVYTYKDSIKNIKSIGTNPNKLDFWNSNLWKKNIEIEGLYPFQIVRIQSETRIVLSINELMLKCDTVIKDSF